MKGEKNVRNKVDLMYGSVEENDKRNRRESDVIFFKGQKYPYTK